MSLSGRFVHHKEAMSSYVDFLSMPPLNIRGLSLAKALSPKMRVAAGWNSHDATSFKS